MPWIRAYIHRLQTRPLVRPWALSGPLLVLLLCLPLLRPLHHPDPRSVSDDEAAILATVQSLADRGTLELNPEQVRFNTRLIRRGDSLFSDQMPVMALLLSGGYWIMKQAGLTLQTHDILVPYLLTLLGVTLPVAWAAGLTYRMGRLFELGRPWRTSLGIAVVFASGLISYAVVLNPHAPAAVLVLSAAGCLVHVAVTRRPSRSGGWLMLAGLCAGFAGVIELAALVFTALLACVILAMRWPVTLRAGGLLLYVIGLTPPLILHAALMLPVTGDLRPGFLHPELAMTPGQWMTLAPSRASPPGAPQLAAPVAPIVPPPEEDREQLLPDDESLGLFGDELVRILWALLGPHGLLSHFPVVLIGVAGVFAVMHRHWPVTTKVLAAASLVGATIILLSCALGISANGWAQAMFAARWYIVFTPMLLFWLGAWARRRHHPVAWTFASLLLAFSTAVSLVGLSDPLPRDGYHGYTAAAALKRMAQGHALPTADNLASK